jgi:hypothetical protein
MQLTVTHGVTAGEDKMKLTLLRCLEKLTSQGQVLAREAGDDILTGHMEAIQCRLRYLISCYGGK